VVVVVKAYVWSRLSGARKELETGGEEKKLKLQLERQ